MAYPKGGQIVSDMARVMADPKDKSGEMQEFLDAIEDPDPNVRRAAVLSRLRLKLDKAILLRKYDLSDATKHSMRNVTVDYVIAERGHEITDLENFYHDQCMRVVFNENLNDFVAAYFTMELANSTLTWHKFS
jgi:hypothetical protein